MPAFARTAPARTDSPIAWNDVEALPVYAALLMGVGLIGLLLADFVSSFEIASAVDLMMLKAVGIFGCIALRQAWMQLDKDVPLDQR